MSTKFANKINYYFDKDNCTDSTFKLKDFILRNVTPNKISGKLSSFNVKDNIKDRNK